MARWCEPLRFADGTVGWMCGSGRAPVPCVYCYAPATRECDGLAEGHGPGRPTCDVAMCHRCTFRPKGTRLDYCRDCRPEASGEQPASPARPVQGSLEF